MEGITILQTVVEKHATWGFSWAGLFCIIAAIGILVAVLHQVLVRAGREDQAMMTTLAGLVIVLTMVIKEISGLFDTVRTLFNL